LWIKTWNIQLLSAVNSVDVIWACLTNSVEHNSR